MIEQEDCFDLAIVDVDSILYQIAYTTPSPALCKKHLDEALDNIMEKTGAADGLVFMKGKNNFRYQVDPEYKGTRKDTIEPEIRERIEMLYEYAKDFCIASHGAEADDLCGVYARTALDNGETYIICHIDKDLNGLTGWHYNFRNHKLYYVSDSEAYRFLMMQVLTGDSTDNIQGLRGIGEKTAIKLTKDTPNTRLWDRVIEIWKEKQPETWYNNFVKCANCIYIREFNDDLRPLTFEELKRKTHMDRDYGHWYPLSDRPANAFGFIYAIINLQTGRRYIGRKQLISVSRKTIAGKSRRQVTRKESDWKYYCSSCKELLDDIRLYGLNSFTFVIYKWCIGPGDLTYSEVKEQWECEVLSRDETPLGERLWYNGNIGAVKFLKPKSYD